MSRSVPRSLQFLLTLLLACATLRADDWPGFRGPHRDGQSAETGLLAAWPEGGPPRLATIAGLGRGYSSPAIVQGKIYITGAAAEKESAYCFDLSGKKIWETPISSSVKPALSPRSTPSVDGDRVYLRNMDGAVLCLDAKTGAIDWTVDVLKDFHGVLPPDNFVSFRMKPAELQSFFGGDDMPGFGDQSVTESVLIDGGNIICTPGGPDACVVALDKTTGKTVWTSKGLSDAPSCASPIAFEFGGVRQIATVTATGVVGIRAADGKPLWHVDMKVQVACPLFQDGTIFVGAAGGAVKLSGQGDAISATSLFQIAYNKGWGQSGFDCSNMLTMGAVLADGCAYGSSSDFDRARTCLDLLTGKVQYHVTEHTMCGRTTGPMIRAGGLLYYQSEFGAVRLVECKPTSSKVISTLWFPYLNGRTTAHPAIADGKLFVRNQDQLYIYDIADHGAAAATPPLATSQPAVSFHPAPVASADWPQFRGPNRDGKSPETGLLRSWPADGPPLLHTLDAGAGLGSPAIVGNRIYIAGSLKRKASLFCFDLDGNKIWDVPVGGAASTPGNDGPTSTPTVDGDAVYYLSDGGEIFALDCATGAQRWTFDLKSVGSKKPWWCYTESLLVDDGKVICTPGAPDAGMLALDKNTGAIVWKTAGERDWPGNGSAIAFEFQGQRLVATVTARSLICVAEKDGKFQFRWDRPSTFYAPQAGSWCEATGGHNVSTPFYCEGMLGAFNIHVSGGVIRLAAGADGAVTANQIWDSNTLWPKASGYICVDGYIYGCGLPGSGAAWTCVELASGKTMFYTEDGNTGGPFLWADGMFICTGFRSKTNVSLIEQSPGGLHELGHFKFASECISYPALAAGRLYLRAMNGKLYVYDVRDHGTSPTAAPATAPVPAAAQYTGALADGSTVTVSLTPPTGQIQFSNQWTVNSVSADADADGISFAGAGNAGDRTLAVSGSVKGDTGTMEIKTGVGLGAKTINVPLKKK